MIRFPWSATTLVERWQRMDDSDSDVTAARSPAAEPAQSSFFLSYAREDLAFRRRLQATMTAAGRRAWADSDIPPLARWRDDVLNAIIGADVFVFVISPDSLRSDACLEELDVAVAAAKRIAPIVCREVDDLPVPPGLAEPNWIFFRDEESFDRRVADLLEAADADVDWLHTHTRLAVRAKDWVDGDRDESLLLRGRDLQTALTWLARAATHGRAEASAVQVQYLEASRTRQAEEDARVREQYVRAVARQLAFQAELERGATPRSVEVSALLAAESISRHRTSEGDHALRRALAQLPVGPRRTLTHPGGRVVALDRHGAVLALAHGRSVELWDLTTGVRTHRLSSPRSIASLTLDDDGTRLVGVDTGHRAHLWRVDNGRLMHRFQLPAAPDHLAIQPGGTVVAAAVPGHGVTAFDKRRSLATLSVAGEVRALALTHDAGLLVVVCAEGRSGQLRLVDLASGDQLEPIPIDGVVRGAALARGAAYLAVMAVSVGPWMGPDRDIHEISVWSLTENGLPHVELRHQDPIRSFGFLADGETVYTVTDRVVGLWRAATGQPVGTVACPEAPTQLALDETALRLAVATSDAVRILDVVSGAPVMALNRQARALAFDAAGALVVCDTDRSEVWGDDVGFELMRLRPGFDRGGGPRTPSDTERQVSPARFSLRGFNAAVHGFSPDGRRLLVDGPDDLLTVVDVDRRLTTILDLGRNPGRSAFTADGRHVVTVSLRAIVSSSGDLGDSRVRVRDVDTAELVHEYDRPDSVQFALNERRGLLVHAATSGEELWVRDAATGDQRHRLRLDEPVCGLRFNDSGTRLAILTEDHALQVLDLDTGRVRAAGSIPASYVEMLDDHGRWALLPLPDGTGVYDLDRARQVTLPRDAAAGRDIVLSPHGDLIAVLPEAGGAQILELPTLRTLCTLGREPVIGFAFLADGHATTVQSDDTVRVWRLEDGVEVMPPLAHPDEIRVPCVDPTGRLIATGCNDGWVRVWCWQTTDLVTETHRRVDQGLSEQELMRFLPDEHPG